MRVSSCRTHTKIGLTRGGRSRAGEELRLCLLTAAAAEARRRWWRRRPGAAARDSRQCDPAPASIDSGRRRGRPGRRDRAARGIKPGTGGRGPPLMGRRPMEAFVQQKALGGRVPDYYTNTFTIRQPENTEITIAGSVFSVYTALQLASAIVKN